MEAVNHPATNYFGDLNAHDLLHVIDIEATRCFNEAILDSGKSVFKDESYRFDKLRSVSSEDSAELLFIVHFVRQVRISQIRIIAKNATNFPTAMKIYINIPDLDLTQVKDTKPVEEFVIESPNLDGKLHCAVNQAYFQRVDSLQIYLTGHSKIQVGYIQIKGKDSGLKRLSSVKSEHENVLNDPKNQPIDKMQGPPTIMEQ